MRKLQNLQINSPKHLAYHLRCEYADIQRCFDNHSSYCKHRTETKKGKTRRFDYAVGPLKKLLPRIKNLLQRIELPESMHGGVKGKSPKTNAEVHVGKSAVLKFDLANFFPSIHCTRVYRLFCGELECSPDVSRILTKLVTVNHSLPQGFPTSTVIANLVARKMVARIENLAKKHECNFTQFVDDGCLSGQAFIENLRPTIDKIICQEGFVASKKPHKRQTQYAFKEEQTVTGIKINYRIDVPAMYLNEVTKEIQSGSYKNKNSIRGKIEHVRRLDRKKGEMLAKMLHQSLKKE